MSNEEDATGAAGAKSPEVQKLRNLQGEVVEDAKVRRNTDGVPTSVTVLVKAPFYGLVQLTLRGDSARAYWSVTKGMRVVAAVRQMGQREYFAETFSTLVN